MGTEPAMHIRIYWGRVAPAAWDALARKYRELMDMPVDGLVSRYVARDANDPESMFTITIWRDLDSVRTWEASQAYRDLYLAAVSPHILGSRSVSLCEVLLARHYGGGEAPA